MATAAEVDFWKDMCRKQTARNDKILDMRDEAIRQQLKAEDKLKTAQAVADGLEWQVQDLEAENAKLRELVRDLWEYIYIGTARDGQSLHDRTRKLGVEVG